MKKLFFVAIVLAAACYIGVQTGVIAPRSVVTVQSSNNADRALDAAFLNHQSDIQVQGIGHVIRLLADDNQGSRHQRFILELASGQSVLVSHNIDLAQRVSSIKVGDEVEFYGEYEWNPQGGVIHWTHHDPRGQHVAGWLKHDGRTHQ